MNFVRPEDQHPDWPIVQAHLLETRIYTQGTVNHKFRNGSIYYLMQAHVQYAVNGMQYTEWFPASGVTTDKDGLDAKRAQDDSKSASVRLNPHDPTDGFVIFN